MGGETRGEGEVWQERWRRRGLASLYIVGKTEERKWWCWRSYGQGGREGGKRDEAGVRLKNALRLTALVLSVFFLNEKKREEKCSTALAYSQISGQVKESRDSSVFTVLPSRGGCHTITVLTTHSFTLKVRRKFY